MDESTQEAPKSGGSMMPIIGVIVVLIIVVGAVVLLRGSATKKPATNGMDVQQVQNPTTAETTVAPTTATQGTVQEMTVSGKNFSFTPSTLTVKKGDTVKITFQSTQGFHDLVVDGYNVQTKTIPAGQTDTISFTADKAGTFEYYCSVGNHRAMGMKGTLTVQ